MAPNTSRAHVWWLLAALVPFAILAAYHWDWGVPASYGDHAQYLAHARAIAEGKPYRAIGYVYHPAAPTLGPPSYPPGFPLTLAPVVALFGVDSPAVGVLLLATLLAFAYVAYRRLALLVAAWQAALATGFALLALEIQMASVVPLSDAGLAALLWCIVLLVDSAPASSWGWWRTLLVIALGFAAMAYRVAGVALVPALALYALMTWRENRGRALVPVAVWGLAAGGAVLSGRVALPLRDYLIPSLEHFGERLVTVWRVYRISLFDLEMYPLGGNIVDDIYHALASLAVLAGCLALLWRYRRTLLTALTITYAALLVLSPAIDGRYLWPLYPLLAAGLMVSAAAVWRAAGRALGRPRASAAPAALLLGAILIGALWRALHVSPPLSLERSAEARALFTWLRESHARRPMRVVFYNPRVLSLETRVPAMGALLATPVRQLRALEEREMTHIVWQSAETGSCRTRLLNALPRSYPERFSLEYENAMFRVYRILSPPGPLPADSLSGVRLEGPFCRSLPPY